MKKKILFVSSVIEFRMLLNATSKIEPGTSFISESLYYPKLIKKIDTDELHYGIPNVVQITPELKYEFEIPYTIQKCRVEVYSWQTLSDPDAYSNFEKYTILIFDAYEDNNVFKKVSFFRDGSIAKAIYPKIEIATQAVQMAQPYSYGLGLGLHSYPSSHSYGYGNIPMSSIRTSYDYKNPTYETVPVNGNEKLIVYEYSGIKY